MKKHWLMIGLCVACAAIFFFVGMFYGKGTAPAAPSGRGFSSSSARAFGGTRGGFGGGSGQVTAKDSQTITLQLQNGNSEVVFYSSSTQVIKPTAATISDVTDGTQVVIVGTQNSDGSLTAQSIQIRTNNVPSGASIPHGQ
jgi:pectate lyase